MALAAGGGLLVLAAGIAQPQPGAQSQTVKVSAGAAAIESGEELPGGEATTRIGIDTPDAFSQFSANMGFAKELDFKIGNGIFRKQWVSSPASTRSSSGLGPLYNARACQSCHLKDGRGHPPLGPGIADRSVSMFLRLSIPPQTDAERKALADGRIAVVG
ncbi:MAG: di-heme oxidoredictase family protein, partial [Hyphomicrobiaceae bacterium]